MSTGKGVNPLSKEECVSSGKARRQCRSIQPAKWDKHQKCRVAKKTIKKF